MLKYWLRGKSCLTNVSWQEFLFLLEVMECRMCLESSTPHGLFSLCQWLFHTVVILKIETQFKFLKYKQWWNVYIEMHRNLYKNLKYQLNVWVK